MMKTVKEIFELIEEFPCPIVFILAVVLFIGIAKGCEAPDFSASNTDQCIQNHLSNVRTAKIGNQDVIIEDYATAHTTIYKEIVKTCKEIYKKK